MTKLDIRKGDSPGEQTRRAFEFLVQPDRVIEVLERWMHAKNRQQYNLYIKNICIRDAGFSKKDVKLVDWDTISSALFLAFVSLNDQLSDEESELNEILRNESVE